MSSDAGQQALVEVASLRGQVGLLHEGLARVANRVDAEIEHNRAERVHAEDERRAGRRATYTAALGTIAILLTALGLFLNHLA